MKLLQHHETSVAHLTFGTRSQLTSEPNVRCKSYNRIIMLLVFRLRHLLATKLQWEANVGAGTLAQAVDALVFSAVESLLDSLPGDRSGNSAGKWHF